MRKRFEKSVKEEILGKIRGGRKVADVAKEHGIADTTVRNWLERDTVSGSAEILETSRLRRENQALLRLVGQLTYESEMQKKNQFRFRG